MALKLFFNYIKKLCCIISMCCVFVMPAMSLPSGYTELEYIEGGQLSNTYINLGYKPTLGMKTILEASIDDIQSQSYCNGGQQVLFSASDASSFQRGFTYAIDVAPNYVALGHGNYTMSIKQSLIDNVRYEFKINYPNINTVSVNDTILNVDSATQVSTSNLILFGWTINDTYNAECSVKTMRMYRLRQWDSENNLIHDWIPVKNASQKIGIYDVVNNIFKTSATSNNFIAGPISIKIATTKYVETAFSPLITALNTAISSVTSVVSTTATQAGQIKTIAETKQNRPDDYNTSEQCPDGTKCLLIQDASGVPHWLEIYDPANDFLESLSKGGKPAPSSFYYKGNSVLQQTYGDETTTVSIQQPTATVGMYHTLLDSEWAVEYTGAEATSVTQGIVYGTAKCISTALTGTVSYGVKATSAQLADSLFNASPTSSSDATNYKQCWCQMTGIGALGTDGTVATGNVYPVNGTSWIYYGQLDSVSACANDCAMQCANAEQNATFRSAILEYSNL